MPRKKIDIIDKLYYFALPTESYTLDDLYSLLKRNVLVLENIQFSKKQFSQSIKNELKKKNSRIAKTQLNRYKVLLTDIHNSKSNQIKLAEQKSIEKIIQKITDYIVATNKKTIEQWIETEFEKKLDESVQKFVESEFKNEILPILIQHINEKSNQMMSVTKGQVKECITEVFSDMIHKLTQQGE